tara:strand:+ start:357 stop:1064 length:708 start_codon:yes stop_codon:yes gene_type:complete
MSGIVGSRLNIRGSGVIGKLGSDGQVFASSGAGVSAVYEAAPSGGGDLSFGGDTFEEAKVIGSNDNYTFSIEAGGTTAMTINTDQSISYPTQPCFSINHTVSQTNLTANSDNTITWGTELFDLGGDFTSNTFTAPVTGTYVLISMVVFAAFDHDASDNVQFEIITSNRSHGVLFDVGAIWQAQPELFTLQVHCITDMDTSDTAIVSYNEQGSGASQADVYGVSGDNHYFEGILVR